MRRLLLLLLFALPAAGHGEQGLLPPGSYVDHTDWIDVQLAPGETNHTQLAFGGGVFQDGWFMLWHGHVDGLVRASLVHDNDSFESWTWNGSVSTEHRLPETGLISLWLENTGATNATVRVYYDQTCECSAKQVRGSGPLWFNVDAPKGSLVALDFLVIGVAPFGEDPELGNVTVTLDHATASEGAQQWPQDFDVVASTTVEGKKTLAFSMPYEANGRDYFRMQIDHDGNQTWSFQVKPTWTVAPPQSVPMLWWSPLILLAFVRR